MALSEIWHPHFIVANEAVELDQTLPDVADVAPDGQVVLRRHYVGGFNSALDLRNFPFDHDDLSLRFVLPNHAPTAVRFVPDEATRALGWAQGVGRASTLTIQDWEVETVTAADTPYQVSPQWQLAGLSVTFTAARRSTHFIVKVLIPLLLIVAMSWAVFWIDPADTGTQVGVSVTAMLTLIAYRFAIDAEVPRLPYLTRLDAFVLMSSLLVFLSLLEVLLTTKLAQRDRLALAHRIDHHCRWAFPLAFLFGSILTLTS
jgi:hypothetical protein